MKVWKDYSKSERSMIVAIGVLLLLILLTSGRVKEGIHRGFGHFFSVQKEVKS